MRWFLRLLAKAGLGIDDRHGGAEGAPLQVGALPYTVDADGTVRVLLITSRRSARWIAPKGWPVRGLTLGEAAAKEAYEEAGVRGRIGEAIGLIPAVRTVCGAGAAAILLHPLRVTAELTTWPERGQRRRRWLSRDAAAEEVASPVLRALILAFDPHAGSAGSENDEGHDPRPGPWPPL
jgi:8-oxo-dGTP pyrophosphatase MutT (NUDIX family)